MLARRDRGGRVDLDVPELLGDLDDVAGALRIQQLCAHDDPARLVARELVGHEAVRSGGRSVRVQSLQRVLLDGVVGIQLFFGRLVAADRRLGCAGGVLVAGGSVARFIGHVATLSIPLTDHTPLQNRPLRASRFVTPAERCR